MGDSSLNWVDNEFQHTNLCDKRLDTRLLLIAKRLAAQFGKNVASSFSTWKDIKAAYRFFSNTKVTIKDLLFSHVTETLNRVRTHSRVLFIQDTTYINYKNRPETEGLDITNGNKKFAEDTTGLMLHNTLALSTEGVPLGLINQSYIDRKQLHEGSYEEKRRRRHLNSNVSEKESLRWITGVSESQALDLGDTEVIHIADRESDFYEFFRDTSAIGAHVLIRAAKNRSINKENRRAKPEAHLFDYMKAKQAQGKMTLNIQVNGQDKYRPATLSIIYSPISMPPPPNKTRNKDGDLPLLDLFAVMAIERNPPKGYEALCWVLLTDLVISSLEDATEKINWYALRWNIELFHKVLKSGCAVEQAQLRHAERLKKYITVKSIIAWRLFWLSRYYKHNEQASCLAVLTEVEWKILYRKTQKTKYLPVVPPTIGEAFIWIAKLGGYIGRRTDPPPGMISLWRGWQRLMDIVEDYQDICG